MTIVCALLLAACGGAGAPAAVVATTPVATATPAPAPTPSPTASPTPSPQPSPTASPTPAFITLSGTIVRGGRPIRAAINFYRVSAEFCTKWARGEFFGPSGVNHPDQLQVTANVFEGPYSVRIPPGTYHVVLSPRVAPGGNWFWNMTLDCAKAETATLTSDTKHDFNVP